MVTDDRAELRQLEAAEKKETESHPPAQPSTPVVSEDPMAEFLRTGSFNWPSTDPIPTKPQRVAPGRKKNAAAEEQMEADDDENNARRV